MRLPVSISAVAMMVSEPPSSMLRAAPKKRFGRCSALASTPPVSTLPDDGHHRVVGAAEARDRVEQDHDVAAVLDQALGFLDHHLGDRDVARGRLVEGRGDHLALHRALHVGHFLGPLVDQQHDQEAFRMVGGDRVGDVLQQHRLAGARRRHDQRALALADRRHDVDDARREILLGRILVLHVQPLFGVERRQVVEVDLVARLLGVLEIDRVDLEQREVALALLRERIWPSTVSPVRRPKRRICEGET